MADQESEHPDERAFLFDDPELGITKTDVAGQHWERWKNRYRKCIALAGKRGGRWLDVAAGSGYGAELISEVADEVVGVELDSNTVRYARKYHARPNISFLNSDILDLRLPDDARFDVITSIETIEHVADPEPFFAKARALLKPDGVFVVTTPESQYGGGPNPLNKWHLHEFTREQLIAALRKHWGRVDLETDTAIFSTGVETVQLYAICRA